MNTAISTDLDLTVLIFMLHLMNPINVAPAKAFPNTSYDKSPDRCFVSSLGCLNEALRASES